ncbi:MAG: DUF6147 family protein [Blautia sp.]|nr:DUF6147 family protein [Blautia sp.]MDY5032364.1 DUF6147 family protein [Blautia sp.]
MKNKVLKKLIVLAVVGMITAGAGVSTQAADLTDPLGTETDADYSEDISYSTSLARSSHLNCGISTIKRVSSNEVSITSTTQGHHECDKLWLSMYLERKVDGVYSTYKYWEFTALNSTSLTRSMTVIVPSGSYYRLRAYHAAKEGTTKESTTTRTQGILVN